MLPPEVAEALANFEYHAYRLTDGEMDLAVIRAHLNRLAEENARLRMKYAELDEVCRNTVQCLRESDDEAERAIAERDALKARIAGAPVQVRPIPPTPEGLVGARFAMIKLEDGERE